MATNVDVTLRESQPWKITFTAHNADDSIMALDGSTEVEFIVSDEDDVDLFIKSTSNGGVVITDGPAGEAEIDISELEQSTYHLSSADNYFYEIRVITAQEYSPQAQGRFIVESSLFAATTNALLHQFRVRFPEFTQSDAIVLIYLADAAAVVDGDESWPTELRDRAVLYLAAHLILMRKNAASQYTAGGTASTAGTGAVRSIRVEDRSVVFDAPSQQQQQAALRAGLNQTAYGQEYLSMLRRNPRWIRRA